MTREDAKYILSGLMKSLNEYCGLNDTGFKAFNMAFKALEQEPCDDAVSRDAVYDAMVEKGQRSRRYKLGEKWELNGEEIREALDTLPSVTPKCPECDDAVSRQSVKNMLIYNWDECCSACIGDVEQLPSVTPKKIECDDAISRKAAYQKMIDLYEEDCERYGVSIPECFDCDRATDALRELPSVTSKLQSENDSTINLHITKIRKHVSDFNDLNDNREECEDAVIIDPKGDGYKRREQGGI